MGLLDNFKSNLLSKKVNKTRENRQIIISPLEKVHSILIIFNESSNVSSIKEQLALVFQNSKITSLTTRNEKVDESDGYSYSYHPNDLGLGKIKNERLVGLINTKFDLVIDFVSETTELDYFVYKTDSLLKIGDLHSTKNYLYDLLLERGNSSSDYIENIKAQLLLLSNNGNN